MIITAPIRVVSESNARDHWRVKHARGKAQRLMLRAAVGRRPLPPLPVVVTLTRVAPRPLDDDNLRGAFKALRDEVAVLLGLPVNARGIADDRDARVVWEYDQRRGARGAYEIEIEIEPMSAVMRAARDVA